MKATELRIGNLVKGDAGKPYKFELSDFSDWWNDHNSHEFGDHIHPISLTEEWLLKFNWKYQDRDVNSVRGKERFYISSAFGNHKEYYLEMQLPSSTPFNLPFVWLGWDIGGGKNWIHLPEGHELRYVHQLQNLYFSLTGEELTIEI